MPKTRKKNPPLMPLERVVKHFQLGLVCDGMMAISRGYRREDLTLMIVSADNEEWRVNLLDRILPRTDWQAFRQAGERPWAVGVVPAWVMKMLDVTYPLLQPMRLRSSKSCVQPVIVIGPKGESMVSGIYVPDS